MKFLATAVIAATAVAAGASAQTVSIGTNPQGSLAYATGAGVAKVGLTPGAGAPVIDPGTGGRSCMSVRG